MVEYKLYQLGQLSVYPLAIVSCMLSVNSILHVLVTDAGRGGDMVADVEQF